MKVEKFKHGEIHYRLPTIPEGLMLLAKIGVKRDGMSEDDQNELVMLSKLIANIEPFITKVECKFGDAEVKTFDKVCEHFQAMPALSAIAGDILSVINGGAEAKKK